MAIAAALLFVLAPGDAPRPAPDAAPDAPVAAPRIWVDPRRGADAEGDGSAERPLRTLARALELRSRMEEEWVELRVHVGAVGAESGERLPVVLPSGVRLVGYGAGSCEIVGAAELPVVVLPAQGRVAVESLALRGGSIGVQVAPGGRAPLEVRLVDLLVEECGVGLDLTRADAPVVLRADGLRTRASATGVAADSGVALDLAFERCRFSGGGEGMVLGDARAGEVGPARELRLLGCRFEGSANAGFVRRGGDGRERQRAPWRFERCLFRGARIGLSLEIPGGDVAVELVGCDFEENPNFGLSCVGSGSTGEGGLLARDCRFRWNGVGAQLLAVGRRAVLEGCRFEDSIGIGLLFGNFTGERSKLRATDCTIACNGAAGVFTICERPEGLEAELVRCTVADNRGNGVERKNRKFGSGALRLERCIVAGNAEETVKLEPAELVGCFVGGDPGFVDRAARDFRVREDSAARDGLGPLGAAPGR